MNRFIQRAVFRSQAFAEELLVIKAFVMGLLLLLALGVHLSGAFMAAGELLPLISSNLFQVYKRNASIITFTSYACVAVWMKCHPRRNLARLTTCSEKIGTKAAPSSAQHPQKGRQINDGSERARLFTGSRQVLQAFLFRACWGWSLRNYCI